MLRVTLCEQCSRYRLRLDVDEFFVICCDFQSELIENGMYRHTCRREGCGEVYVTSGPRLRSWCRSQANPIVLPTNLSAPIRQPSLARRAASFAGAQSRWLTAGRPMRSVERIEELFAICQECEHFRPGATHVEGTCRLCGCRLRRVGGLLNKIQMATEGCPARPPKWEPEVS